MDPGCGRSGLEVYGLGLLALYTDTAYTWAWCSVYVRAAILQRSMKKEGRTV